MEEVFDYEQLYKSMERTWLKAEAEVARLKEQLHDSYQGHLLEVVIPKLEAECADNERYTVELYNRSKTAESENALLLHTLETVTKQRDLAVEDIERAAIDENGMCCVCRKASNNICTLPISKMCSFEYCGFDKEADK